VVYTDGNNLFKVSVKSDCQRDGNPVQLTDDGPDVYNQQPSFSNNGKSIVFHSNRETDNFNFDIWILSEKTTKGKKGKKGKKGSSSSSKTEIIINRLTGFTDYGDFDPSYSKNGKYVAYAGFTNPTPSFAKRTGDHASNSDFAKNTTTIPSQFELEQNYPNPFNPTTHIRFSLAEGNHVLLAIYNSSGQLVRTLVAEEMTSGQHNVQWNGTDETGAKVASGVYLYRIKAGSYVQSKKMILMK